MDVKTKIDLTPTQAAIIHQLIQEDIRKTQKQMKGSLNREQHRQRIVMLQDVRRQIPDCMTEEEWQRR